MSLFGSLMGDMEDDPIFGSHMRTMRQMNSMMNSLFADPFGMMGGFGGGEFDNRALTHHHHHRNSMNSMHNSLMPFNMPVMPNINRLLSGSLDSLGGGNAHSSYSTSSTVVSMTSGPDGRPQVYKATSSTRVAPGGIKETQRTVTDTRTGTKKMAIGHHIGERAHIIEKEQNMHTGDREERQDFINLEEEEADDFNKEWETKSRSRSEIPRIAGAGPRTGRHGYASHYSGVPAITAGTSSRRHRDRHTTSAASVLASGRRSIRSPKLAIGPATTSRTPYSPPGQTSQPRKSKNVKTVSGSPHSPPEADN